MEITNFDEIPLRANQAMKSISGGFQTPKILRGPALRAMFKISATHHVHHSQVVSGGGGGDGGVSTQFMNADFHEIKHLACRDGFL